MHRCCAGKEHTAVLEPAQIGHCAEDETTASYSESYFAFWQYVLSSPSYCFHIVKSARVV